MSKMNDGGSAFPLVKRWTGDGYPYDCAEGMSLRDWFAGQALVAIIKAEEAVDVDSIKERARIRQRNHRAKFRDAKRAYAIADAMLAARQPQEGEDA